MKIILTAITLLLVLSSCKQETVTTQETIVKPDGSSVTTTTTTTEYNVQRLKKAEDNYVRAEKEVVIARESGDTKAEQVARDAANKAKEAWEVTKRELKEAGQDVKEGYNKTLEKAKSEQN